MRGHNGGKRRGFTDDLTPQQKLYSAYGESEVILSTGSERGRATGNREAYILEIRSKPN